MTFTKLMRVAALLSLGVALTLWVGASQEVRSLKDVNSERGILVTVAAVDVTTSGALKPQRTVTVETQGGEVTTFYDSGDWEVGDPGELFTHGDQSWVLNHRSGASTLSAAVSEHTRTPAGWVTLAALTGLLGWMRPKKVEPQSVHGDA